MVMEKTLELGTGLSSGRLWDVRLVTPKAQKTDRSILLAEKAEEAVAREGDGIEEAEESGRVEGSEVEGSLDNQVGEEEKEEQVLVCRPKVGEKIVGGGFVAVFRKEPPTTV